MPVVSAATAAALAKTLDGVALLDEMRRHRTIDLSHPLHAAMPYFPGRAVLPFEHHLRSVISENGLNAGRFSMGEHQGTHLDAPSHFIRDGEHVDALKADDLIAAAVVIDVTAQVAGDDDYCLEPGDLSSWEEEHGTVPAGAWLLVRSGWSTRWSDPAAFCNQDASGVPHFPAVSPAAAEVLVQRGVAGVGLETLSADNSVHAKVRSPAHKTLLGAGCLILENLASLDKLPHADVLLIVGVLPIVGGSGAPARVLATCT